MSKTNRNTLFWISYADLMSALFIVALALFILSYKLFKDREDIILGKEREIELAEDRLNAQERSILQLRSRLTTEELTAAALIDELETQRGRLLVMEEEYEKLREIQEAIERLDPRYFVYQPEYKRHVLREQVQFPKGSSNIRQQYYTYLTQSGQELQRLVREVQEARSDIKYLLVIEGQASQDEYERNYELSYERALALFSFWKQRGITFDPDKVEVIISGSGVGGVGREQNESLNQRFLIQIIPKIGELPDLNVDLGADSTATDSLFEFDDF